MNTTLLTEVLGVSEQFGITDVETAEIVGQGRIARNCLVHTERGACYVLRSYDLQGGRDLGYARSRFEFEATVLRYLDGRLSIETPSLVATCNGGFNVVENDVFHVLYRMIDGSTLPQSGLSTETAAEAGKALRELVEVSSKFVPEQAAESGGLDYVREITRGLLQRYPELRSDERLAAMAVFVDSFPAAKALEASPKGIVHGDYFFENTLWTDSGSMTGMIDFGDSFYGALLHDVTIGAMEFAFTEGEHLEPGFFKVFLQPFEDWFKNASISIDLFSAVIRLNCVRFSTHLIALGLDDGMSIADTVDPAYNPYISRFERFADSAEIATLSTFFSKQV